MSNIIHKYLLSMLFLGLSLPKSVYSMPLIGQDFLGIQNEHFDFRQASGSVLPSSAIGMLDYTFGTSLTPVRYLLSNRTPLYFRAHLFNGACVRGRNCGSYDPLYGLSIPEFEKKVIARDKKILEFLRGRVAVYRALSLEFPKTTFLISPVLEHDLTKKAWRILADTVLEVWPAVQLVNSPDGNLLVEPYKKAWIERHGVGQIGIYDIASLDGTDGTDIDIDAWLKKVSKAKIVMLWTRSFNCRNQGPWEDPRARDSCPSADTFNLMVHLPDDRGKAPKFEGKNCKSIVAFKSPMIFKPLAEDFGNEDRRSNKPVAITKLGKANLSLLSRSGKVIGTLGYYGAFTDPSLLRYYSGSSGGTGEGAAQIESLGRKTSGSPWIWLKGKDGCAGPLVPGKRQGKFR